MHWTLQHLRRHALAKSFFPPTTLRKAIEKLGFVQADPIRSPARAQDLILRHRVRSYHAGELEERYPKLGLEEDFVYAYGFVPPSTKQLLHPRLTTELSSYERKVLALVAKEKQIHPRELEAHLGKKREINAWGGYSQATTHALQALHRRGLLRIAGRENGIRLYQLTSPQEELMDPAERLETLILLLATIFQPAPERSLRATLQYVARSAPGLKGRHSILTGMLQSGALDSTVIDDVRYVWPPGRLVRSQPPARVRFLAPFDPLVWDRLRFELFWGWRYRFEAYTPQAKRKLGYYAMPLLWRDEIVGWVNATNLKGRLSVQRGFASKQPDDPLFQTEFDAEVERFRRFLNPVQHPEE